MINIVGNAESCQSVRESGKKGNEIKSFSSSLRITSCMVALCGRPVYYIAFHSLLQWVFCVNIIASLIPNYISWKTPIGNLLAYIGSNFTHVYSNPRFSMWNLPPSQVFLGQEYYPNCK